MLRIEAGPLGAAERRAFDAWHDASPAHAQAWAKADRLRGLLAQVPADTARATLGRHDRRSALKHLAAMALALPMAGLAWQTGTRAGLGADARTAIGERRWITLPGGSQAMLNTATAVDLQVSRDGRRLHLLRGEVLLQAAPDTHSPARPWQISTDHGQAWMLHGRMSVHLQHPRSQIRVLDGTARVTPARRPDASLVVGPGQQTRFDAQTVLAPAPLDTSALAWTHGMLAADARPLADVVAELARHRRGVLRCDPQIASLPVSGAFPLDDIPTCLAMLAGTYPVRVQQAAGGLWTTVTPA